MERTLVHGHGPRATPRRHRESDTELRIPVASRPGCTSMVMSCRPLWCSATSFGDGRHRHVKMAASAVADERPGLSPAPRPSHRLGEHTGEVEAADAKLDPRADRPVPPSPRWGYACWISTRVVGAGGRWYGRWAALGAGRDHVESTAAQTDANDGGRHRRPSRGPWVGTQPSFSRPTRQKHGA